jgi:hypothetical protein
MRFVLAREAALWLGAVLFSLGSCSIQRLGPDHAIYCALGKSKEGCDIYCPKPVLNAGWPAPFAFDRHGISVEGRIGFPEDDFRFWPFVANLAFFRLLLGALLVLCIRARRGSERADR